ncbi:tetratricopeptide repeat protein [Aeromonas hydrophila]|uniref:tetratricopeptide repeat protein n=1 Tax=Aeromonas hydrophila TaxID=644 RepID=UPI001B3A1F7D|nr:tetratricopeptide repeat protein [Aeromonas hydrophila]MCF7677845.1 tetratricopeptide repeat protein [Aeromonas hydrophila]MCF7690803.1 tetratricopeptide repeat protein [Aeromonas hydrophila]MCF7693343.1 tetratricopeptide repeat protein [Aeromonas hydrophila]MCF7771966.1 tetratricopeptide repeat protein [Aeromonas hydrophila]MCF7774200.1 tetratricopeptide repeat protein [Aeromonas hydrophila]
MDHVQTWTLAGFLAELQRITERMPDRRFVFILGAGASIQSGVKSAHVLATEWMQIIHHRDIETQIEFDEWLHQNPLQIDEWEPRNLARFYPTIFEHCFSGDHEAGYAALESAIEPGKPSFGYAVLSWIMTNTNNNMVITTNFDNLVADSLYLYGQRTPHVIGHESLAGYLKPLGGRPMVAKIHRDLFTDPINDASGTGELKAPWINALKSIFKFYTPIFIGYGGNDGSLMNFLSALSPADISGRPFWCYYEPAGKPSEAIKRLLQKHKGILIPTLDWDTLMLSIGNAWGYQHQSQIDALDKHILSMKDTLQQQILQTSQDGGSAVKEKLKPSPKDDQSKSWLDWALEAQAEDNINNRISIYDKALNELPNSSKLHIQYASLLRRLDRADDAEKHYLKAIEIDPEEAIAHHNYANILATSGRKNEAIPHYIKAIEIAPNDAGYHNSYASLLSDIGRFDEAEDLYKKAISLDPNDPFLYCSYADFLNDLSRDSEADDIFKTALNIGQNDAFTHNRYASFLLKKNRFEESEIHYKRAIEINPKYVFAMNGYAYLLLNSGRQDEAEKLYKMAIELEPKNKFTHNNYAKLLSDTGRFDEAEKHFKKAIEIDPNNQYAYHEYALLLRKLDRTDEAEALVGSMNHQVSSGVHIN